MNADEILDGWVATGDVTKVADLARALPDSGRRVIAKALPAYLRETRAATQWGFLADHQVLPLLAAGMATMSGAAAVAGWISRRELRSWSSVDRDAIIKRLAATVADRPDEWRADVAHRLSARLSPNAGSWRDTQVWELAAELVRGAHAQPPIDDAFVRGWVLWGGEPAELAADPFADALLPRFFEVDGIGAVLSNRKRWWPDSGWAGPVVELVRAGRLERQAVLDGCVSRFLRGGEANDLQWFVQLYDALQPTLEESEAHLRDHVRILPASSPAVAEHAFAEVRRLDEAGRLPAELFAETADALAFRPERKLVRTALTWLDRTARKRDRVDATLTAVAVAFGHESLEIQERAAKVAAKHASQANEQTCEAIREAAASLPHESRERIAAAFGAAAEPVASIAVAAPSVPMPALAELPPPIASIAELVEESVRVLRDHEIHSVTAERALAGLVEFAYSRPDETRDALRPVVLEVAPWLDYDSDFKSNGNSATWLGHAIQALVPPTQKPNRHWDPHRYTVPPNEPLSVLQARMDDVRAAVGRSPVLLSTPTGTDGHVAPDALLDRMERIEAAGQEPGPLDLDQALLRLPRDIDPDVLTRARRLTSRAGQQIVDWLTAEGLHDPGIACAAYRIPWAYGGKVSRVLPTITTPDTTSTIAAQLCELPAKGEWLLLNVGPYYHAPHATWWPTLLPSHREVIAAHALVLAPSRNEDRSHLGAMMLALAHADGPVGPAMSTLLAYELSAKHRKERADAVEALLTLCAKATLPVLDLAQAIATLVQIGELKLNRVTEALIEAARAGAYADILTVIADALPVILPAPGEKAPNGLPDLIALASEAAETTGARVEIKGLADVAARGGSSRLVREAVRLQHILTGA